MKADKGFSLLEVIITLSILSSCVLLFSFAISQIQTTRSQIKDERQIEWHLFINQLEFELNSGKKLTAGRDRITFEIYDTKEQRDRVVTYERYLRMIRRQVGSLGHQPILLDVSKVEFTLLDKALTIKVEFINGETYQATLRVNTKDT
ncbi:MAG: competence type IV pilus minor pilin ComGF [Alkalibacterium sp.]